MNPPTKLAITGVGVAVLMLLAFLTPAPAMGQIASCTTDASGNTVCDPTGPRGAFDRVQRNPRPHDASIEATDLAANGLPRSLRWP
jgi:hypothetical protein